MKIDRDAKIELLISSDAARPHLNNAYLDVENKCLVATDGHRLIKYAVEIDEGDTTGFVSATALKAARKLTPKDHQLIIRASKVLVLSDGTVFPRPDESAGAFVPYERVIPDYSKREVVKVGLNAQFLYEICQALGGSKKCANVSLTFPHIPGGKIMLDPIRVEFGVQDGVAILMPTRV